MITVKTLMGRYFVSFLLLLLLVVSYVFLAIPKKQIGMLFFVFIGRSQPRAARSKEQRNAAPK